MDTGYLQREVGECLRKCLAEVVEKRPYDPIEYIAHWLRKHTINVKYEEKKIANAKQLEQEKADWENEKIRREQMKEEALRHAEMAAEKKKQEEEQQRSEAQAALASKLAPVEERDEPADDAAKTGDLTEEPPEAVAVEGDVGAEDAKVPAGEEEVNTAEAGEEETPSAVDEGGTGEEAGEATEEA